MPYILIEMFKNYIIDSLNKSENLNVFKVAQVRKFIAGMKRLEMYDIWYWRTYFTFLNCLKFQLSANKTMKITQCRRKLIPIEYQNNVKLDNLILWDNKPNLQFNIE